MARSRKWIQRAVKKPGALTEYAQRVGCLRAGWEARNGVVR
jgi:hypothetical protein